MQTGSETAGGKSDQGDSGGVDPEKEAAYWREQHAKQPYAKNYSYDEVEESVAADYEEAKPGSALPWDTVRPAASAVFDRLGGVIGPRDSDRGIRGSI